MKNDPGDFSLAGKPLAADFALRNEGKDQAYRSAIAGIMRMGLKLQNIPTPGTRIPEDQGCFLFPHSSFMG
jgi:hypothetical protein